jgi:hypothetical protein
MRPMSPLLVSWRRRSNSSRAPLDIDDRSGSEPVRGSSIIGVAVLAIGGYQLASVRSDRERRRSRSFRLPGR